MSNKERIMQLIDDIPEYKLIFIVNMLEDIRGYAGESIEPDEWDLQMIAEAEANNDGESISIEELAKELDITLWVHHIKYSLKNLQ